MKLLSVTIENYRSIGTLELDLDSIGGSYCRILAGINESGKSNILKALALLSKDNQVVYSKDANKKAKNDKKDISIRYELEKCSIDLLLEHMKNSGVPLDIIKKLNIGKIERVVSFDSSSARNDYFKISLSSKPLVSEYQFYTSSKSFELLSDSKDMTEETIPEIIPVASDPLATASNVPEPVPVQEKTARIETKEDWENILEDNFAQEALEELIPIIVFWEYNDRYLINKSINLTEFSANPASVSKPLHNVFNLADYTDIQIPVVIKEALEDGAGMGELADKLEKTVNNYLMDVWPEHKVGIKVHTDSTSITFHVVEKDIESGASSGRYDVSERSDGFKHFFAILLNLAAENSTSKLKDCLILLDEPEIHLHPSGAKFLRDELLNIAKNNVVIYSTHSIFMIDRTCLDRHYKIIKENENTHKIKIDASNPFREELIYEALGTSILDLISEHNILFEGLTDKKLFDVFTQKFKMDIKPLDITAMNIDGESNFDKYCKFFNKKNIKGYILADSDTEGANAKSRILANNSPAYNINNTFVINDILETNKKSCLEDLLPKEVLQKCLEEYCGIILVIDDKKTFKDQISDYNKTSEKKIDASKLKEHIANYVCTDITKSSMTKPKTIEKYKVYHEFITNLHKKLKDSNI